MTPEEIEELLALDSLGLLTTEEKRPLAELLASDPALREQAEKLRAVAELLPFSAAPQTPRAELKRNILRALDQRIASQTTAPSRNFLPWAMAAAFAILAGWLMWQNANEPSARDLHLALLRPPTLDSQATAQIAWNEKTQRGKLIARHMDALPPHCCYQVWIIAADQDEPVSGGVFSVREDGAVESEVRPGQPMKAALKFLVSMEKEGGVKKAEGPFVLAGF